MKSGESSTVKATFKTKGKKGRQTKSITVTTNDPKNPTLIIKMTGEVIVPAKTATKNTAGPTNKTMAPKARH